MLLHHTGRDLCRPVVATALLNQQYLLPWCWALLIISSAAQRPGHISVNYVHLLISTVYTVAQVVPSTSRYSLLPYTRVVPVWLWTLLLLQAARVHPVQQCTVVYSSVGTVIH